jgi:hypothetical protein
MKNKAQEKSIKVMLGWLELVGIEMLWLLPHCRLGLELVFVHQV